MSRIKQVIKYGWKHSKVIANKQDRGLSYQLAIFFDILYCFKKYRMWSNQYLQEEFYLKTKLIRKQIGAEYYKKGVKRDLWQKDFVKNRKFFHKYSQKKYEIGRLRDKRKKAYQRQYNTGDNLAVEYNVNISRQHYLDGEIKIGNNVLLAKNVFIDYSGKVTIGDNVRITDGVMIESHHHAYHAHYKRSRDIVEPTKIEIAEGAIIGTRAVVLASCSYIGKYARIGAGSVVTKDIPDYAIAVGVPARVLKYQNIEDE